MKIQSLFRGLFASILSLFAAVPSLAEPAAFSFDRNEYYLRGDEQGIREYLTKGETFENWTTLISVREYSGTDDPRAYANVLLKKAKASEPDSHGQLLENEEAGSYIADFLLFSTKGEEPAFAEWNLWRIERKGDGVEAVQYARRFYKVTESTAQELIEARKIIVPQLAKFVDPELPSPSGEQRSNR